eukprot:IDg9794t1
MVSGVLDSSLTINADELPVKSIDNSLTHSPTSNNSAETLGIVRGATVEASRGQKRHMSIDVEKSPVAQRSRAEEDVRVDIPLVTKASEAPTRMSIRISLDRLYEYAVAVCAEGIEIFPVVSGEAGGFSFTDVDATGPAKIVVVICRLKKKTGRRTFITTNLEADEFDVQYPNGEPYEN